MFLLSVRLLLPYMWSSIRRTWNFLWVWVGEVSIRATDRRLIPPPIERPRRATCHYEAAGVRCSDYGRRNSYDESWGRRKKGVRLSCHEDLAGGAGWNNGAPISHSYYRYLQEAHCSKVKSLKTGTVRINNAGEGDWRLEEN